MADRPGFPAPHIFDDSARQAGVIADVAALAGRTLTIGPLAGRSLLITGGTGSLGTALVRYLLDPARVDAAPARLVVFSRRWQEQARLREATGNDPRLRWFIGDVRDPERLRLALRGVDDVIHAAAMKDVPAAEYNPTECIATNVAGTEHVLRAALDEGVRRVLVISSDKAVQAINTYGRSKALAESLAVAFNSYAGADGTRAAVARYGNVAGSSGSVIPLFRRQAAAGGALTLTDPRMTRFWITMADAVRFVLDCLGALRGGETFVPHLKAAPVIDLARALAPAAPLITVGLRPGEKVHEWMLAPEEHPNTRDLGWAYCVAPAFAYWAGATAGAGSLLARYTAPGSPVPDSFVYISASAPRLDAAELEALLAQTPAV